MDHRYDKKIVGVFVRFVRPLLLTCYIAFHVKITGNTFIFLTAKSRPFRFTERHEIETDELHANRLRRRITQRCSSRLRKSELAEQVSNNISGLDNLVKKDTTKNSTN
jgi:hypothetical protein